jgi:hypothetical protein
MKTKKKKRKLSVVIENHVSKKKKEEDDDEDEKRKEKRDDKLKTLSFASIYSHEKKKGRVKCAEWKCVVLLSLSQGCCRHHWSY